LFSTIALEHNHDIIHNRFKCFFDSLRGSCIRYLVSWWRGLAGSGYGSGYGRANFFFKFFNKGLLMLALYDRIASLYNYLLGYKIMTDINYTAEMVATIEAAQPLDLAKAKALGAQLDRGYRSIIAKAKREGFEYISKPAPAKKKLAPSKADMVAAICAAVDTDSLDGLEKATGAALNKLLSSLA
jgi:hypothetical protein